MKKIIFLLLLFSASNSIAQNVTNSDFNTWSWIEIGYKANSKLSFDLQQQLRLKENSSTVDNYFTELSSKYEVFKNFDLGVGLRYINSHDNQGNKQGYDPRFRYNIDGSYSYKLKKFKLSHRVRYQNRQDLGVADGDPRQSLRFKTSLDYNISKWKLDPELSGEIFTTVNDPLANGPSKYRITLGTRYKMGDFGQLKAIYAFEGPLGDNNEVLHILGLGYSYTIKHKK